MVNVYVIKESPLTRLVEFAEKNRVSAIFREVHGSKTIYYLTKPGYKSHDSFEDKLEALQHRLFPENNTLIFCTSKSREDPIWAKKSERVY